MKRTGGVLMHVSSLPGGYSCGSFGESAKEFIDFLADCGFGCWQVLPFGIPDGFHSPYKALSAFAGNPYFLDLETLAKNGLLTRAELDAAREGTPYTVEYDRLDRERLPLLRIAARRAWQDPTLAREIERTIGADKNLSVFCDFMARRKVNGGVPWYLWTENGTDEDELRLWKFLQYEFLREWDGIRAYAALRGIRLIGDIPIYLDYDSADVWANPGEFQLDARLRPTAVAGVPPDYFSEDGQLWGNPLYNWDEMKKNGFRFWRNRLGAMFRLFDGVRIDHFRAIDSYWSVPADAMTAREGKWVKGPGMEFIRAIKETAAEASAKAALRDASVRSKIADSDAPHASDQVGSAKAAVTPDDPAGRGHAPSGENPGGEVTSGMPGAEKFIIAEDLGDIGESVRHLVDASGFPGMRVMQFGFLGDSESPHLPHNYPENCIAYTGTHDNNTLLGYLWELDPATRGRVLSYCGYRGRDDWDRPEAYDAVIRTMLSSHAGTVILPIQDLLHYGSDTRINTPGRAGGNWEFRLTREQLDTIDRGLLREWAELFGR